MSSLLFYLFLAQISSEPLLQLNLTDAGAAFIQDDQTLAIDAEGYFCIYDEAEKKLSFYDPKGMRISSKGGKGQGPGMFQFFAAVCAMPNSAAFASIDWGNQQLNLWNREGKLLETYKTPRPLVGGVCNLSKAGLLFYSDDPVGGYINPTINCHNPKQAVTSKVFEKKMPAQQQLFQKSSGSYVASWNARLHYAVGHEFLAVADGFEGTVGFFDPKGKELGKAKEIFFKRFPVTQAQIELEAEHLSKSEQMSFRSKPGNPAFWPKLMGLKIDAQERLWVFGPGREQSKAYPIEILDKTGKSLLRGELNFIPHSILETVLYNVEEKGDDQILVKRSYHLKE